MRSDRLKSRLALAVLVLLAVPGQARAADAPRWLRDLAMEPTTSAHRAADAVVLLDEEHVTVQSNGRAITRRQYAVRVQTSAGARAGAIREVYNRSSGDVRNMKAWVMVDGRVIELGKDQTLDAALVDNDVYNEARVRVLSAASQMIPGAVFGAESEMSESTVFSQTEWRLRSLWPVAHLRRVLTLPAGWKAQGLTFNHAPLEPVATDTTRTWTLDGLPAEIDEPAAPPDEGKVPRLAVTYYGSPRSETAFENWASVGRWLATLQDPQGRPTPAVVEKARALVASATSDIERVRAIAAYVQQVQYISIQTGIGRGGGYIPHAAADVLQKNYGDCKDKANLMRALLAGLGVPSSLVGIYSGDASYVREEWPSPQQFNHAIIAIPVARGTRLPAVAEDESGSTLFFDPTDTFTPLGELPLALQGSLGLVVSATQPRLTRLPSAGTDSHVRERTLVASLSTDGTLSGTLQIAAGGRLAGRERALLRSLPGDGYLRQLETAVRNRIPGAALAPGTITDDLTLNRFRYETRLQARLAVQNGTLRLLSGTVSLGDVLPKLAPGSRQTPVALEPRSEQDRFEVTLPSTIRVDELPPPVTVETSFARFDVRWTLEGARLIRVLSLRVNQSEIPSSEYAAVRAFVDRFRDAERMAAVITRR
jgi:hypothetical protein